MHGVEASGVEARAARRGCEELAAVLGAATQAQKFLFAWGQLTAGVALANLLPFS